MFLVLKILIFNCEDVFMEKNTDSVSTNFTFDLDRLEMSHKVSLRIVQYVPKCFMSKLNNPLFILEYCNYCIFI